MALGQSYDCPSAIEWILKNVGNNGRNKNNNRTHQSAGIVLFPWHVLHTENGSLATLQWRHDECDGVSNHQHHNCLLNRLFRRRSKKTSKLCVTGHCAGNSPVTGEFPSQRASNAEYIFIWWRHHALGTDSCPEASLALRLLTWSSKYVRKYCLFWQQFLLA